MIRKQLTVVIAMGAVVLLSVAGQVEAGTCQPVKAKGVAAKLATAQAYAQADLKQTAKHLGALGGAAGGTSLRPGSLKRLMV